MTRIAAILDAMRTGAAPCPDDMQILVDGLTDGGMTDAQVGAFAMAVCCHGLPDASATALTKAMTASGTCLPRLSDKPRLDKHSTGGLGDATSLVLAPLLAAMGAEVPMISGRALGHTGGTLDKLEAVPGISADIGAERMTEILRDCGCVIAAASAGIAPADRRLYAIRDTTGTVQSAELITASILSKKLAATLDALILDVKTGAGAVLADPDAARDLAERLVAGARAAGLKATALITAMDQPLLPCLGNGLEMAACLHLMRGEKVSARFERLVLSLAGELCALAGVSASEEALREALQSGAAYERFAQMARAMGASRAPLPDHIPTAPVELTVLAERSGTLNAIDGRALGWAAHHLGANGDPRTGISQIARLGSPITPGQPLCTLHALDPDQAARTAKDVVKAFRIGERAEPMPLILHRV